MFEQYGKYSKVDVAKAIDLELKGDIENCLVAVGKKFDFPIVLITLSSGLCCYIATEGDVMVSQLLAATSVAGNKTLDPKSLVNCSTKGTFCPLFATPYQST